MFFQAADASEDASADAAADINIRKLLLQEKMEKLQNTRLEEMRLDYQRFLKTRIKSGQNKSP